MTEDIWIHHLGERTPVHVGAAHEEMFAINQPKFGVEDASTKYTLEIYCPHGGSTCNRWNILIIYSTSRLYRTRLYRIIGYIGHGYIG